MTKNKKDPKADEYFRKVRQWREELKQLRRIVLGCGLDETVKWGKPCYVFGKSNVVILYSFKESVGLGFFKGSLLGDPAGILSAPGEHSQAVRMIKFTGIVEILDGEVTVREYVERAVEIEKAGLKVDFKKEKLPIPKELLDVMEEIPALKTAFEALTPGRRRGYLLYFSGAKQSKTRKARIEKCVPLILEGKGLGRR